MTPAQKKVVALQAGYLSLKDTITRRDHEKEIIWELRYSFRDSRFDEICVRRAMTRLSVCSSNSALVYSSLEASVDFRPIMRDAALRLQAIDQEIREAHITPEMEIVRWCADLAGGLCLAGASLDDVVSPLTLCLCTMGDFLHKGHHPTLTTFTAEEAELLLSAARKLSDSDEIFLFIADQCEARLPVAA